MATSRLTGRFQAAVHRSADDIGRAAGGYGTISLIGLLGYGCCCADAPAQESAPIAHNVTLIPARIFIAGPCLRLRLANT